MGVSREMELRGLGKAAGLQLGLAVRSIRYQRTQADNVLGSRRDHTASWLEWMPTWGLSLRFPEFAVRYAGRVALGSGRPEPQVFFPVRRGPLAGGDILSPGPPGSRAALDDVSVVMHQVSLSLPLR